MGKITKADIIDALYEKTGEERQDLQEFVDLFLEEVKKGLVEYNTIELRGFGTFEIKIRKGRAKARNPRTGAIVSVEPHGIAAFRAGKQLKQEVWAIKTVKEETGGRNKQGK